MNKKNNQINNSKLNNKNSYISIEKKVIKKSLDSNVDFDLIDNANAYYSERYGWTLKKN